MLEFYCQGKKNLNCKGWTLQTEVTQRERFSLSGMQVGFSSSILTFLDRSLKNKTGFILKPKTPTNKRIVTCQKKQDKKKFDQT